MEEAPILGNRPFGKRDKRLLLVCWYDPTGIRTVIQSISRLQASSRHELVIANVWRSRRGTLALPSGIDLTDFDGVILHHTATYYPGNLKIVDANLARKFKDYDGVKILMKQDEQVHIDAFRDCISEKKFDLLLTCVPAAEQEKVYPRNLMGSCELQRVFTGYVSPELRQGRRGQQTIDISYRGSLQPLAFGRLGYEKRGIGYDVQRALSRSTLDINVSSRWQDRIMGDAWFDFLAASKAVLGVESGTNLFDFDGSVQTWCEQYAKRKSHIDPWSEEYYRKAHAEFLHRFEDNINYAQISPRHLEAASTFALQILYEGEYAGIFRPWEHFVPLRRDLKNLDQALDTLRDDQKRKEIVERAFEEIIVEPSLQYERFVKDIDDAIDRISARKGIFAGKDPAANSVTGDSLVVSNGPTRPTAFYLVPHAPKRDPRIGWFVSTLSRHCNVYIFGTYHFGEKGEGPRVEKWEDGSQCIQVERTQHQAHWLPSIADLQRGQLLGREILADLNGYATAAAPTLFDRIGALANEDGQQLATFRALCNYFVNTNAALVEAAEKTGVPDLVIATDLETLPAGVALAESYGSYLVYDAHEYWPHSYINFENWEVEFWQAIERRLCRKADLRLTVSPQLAREMSRAYQQPFLTLPNCAVKKDGLDIDLESAFRRRLHSKPLRFLFLGNFAEGRGIEELVRAWELVRSGAQLLLTGPDNPFKTRVMEIASSLGILNSKVFFPSAVTENQLVTTALSADVGLISYNPSYYGYKYPSPNKLSQYAAAGLPILSSTTQYVAEIVRSQDIGFVVDIEDASAVSKLVDSLPGQNETLVSIGRRSRRFFEEQYHWEAKFGPIMDSIQNGLKGRARVSSTRPDLSWIRRSESQSVELTSLSFRPGESVLSAERGASIRSSSGFLPRPHDADYLLRPATESGYAAAQPGRPQWIEIDLGQPCAVEDGRIEWLDQKHFGIAFVIEVRLYADQDWEQIYAARENQSLLVDFSFAARWVRYVRLSGTRLAGQDRMLIRRLQIFACIDQAAAGEMPSRKVLKLPERSFRDFGKGWKIRRMAGRALAALKAFSIASRIR